MDPTSSDRDPIEALAEEFLARRRRGEHPTIAEYAERYPALAEGIRAVFPAMALVEDLGPGTEPAGDRPSARLASSEQVGDYRIVREIGRGGMGIVYEAEQVSLGRRVALKVLPAGALTGSKQVRRFEREARSAARLHHTNIVPVFGAGNHEGTHFYVMQLIQGQGLDAVLDELKRLRYARASGPAAGGIVTRPGLTSHPRTAADIAYSLATGRFAPLPDDAAAPIGSATFPYFGPPEVPLLGRSRPEQAPSSGSDSSGISVDWETDRRFARGVARIGVQVAEALAYAHGQGVLHRDIKPANLLSDENGNVWVTDFGLAKAVGGDDLTHTGELVGTVRYMAPERFRGQGDLRADIYSLGLTLYELLALRPAFEEKDRAALIRQVTQEDAPRLRKVNRAVPRDLETIVHKAVAREPGQRYATAAALAEDLNRFLEGRPIRARQVSAAERAWRWSKRNPGLAVALGSTAAALVIVAGLAVVHADQKARIADQQMRIANEQTRARVEISGLNVELARRGADLETSLAKVNLNLAMFQFERAREACEKGEIGPGLVHLTACWRSAVAAGDVGTGWRRIARTGLAGWQRRHIKLQAVLSHAGEVTSAVFSPDGKTVMTGSADGAARFWDAATGRPLGPTLTHPQAVSAVAYGPDGQTVLTGCGDRTARLWDPRTGRPIGPTLTHQGRVSAVAFSPDGKTVMTGSADGAARLWDAATGRPLGPTLTHPEAVSAVAYGPDGKTVLTGCWDTKARLWDAATGRPLGPTLTHPDAVHTVAFGPDGKTALTGGADGTVRLWDATTGRPLGPTLVHQGPVNAVAFGPDGRTLLTGGHDHTARLWDATTGRPLGSTLTHQGPVNAVAFGPGGQAILTASNDHTARLWDATTGRPLGPTLTHQAAVRAVAYGPDGKSVLTGSNDHTARLWDVATGRPLGQPLAHQGEVNAVAFSPDGQTVLTGSWDGTARLWDATTGRPLKPALTHQGQVMSATFGPDGQTVFIGSWDQPAQLWDATTGRPLGPTLTHPGPVFAVAYGPDGRTLLTGNHDRTARLWDATTRRPIGPILTHQDSVLSVAFGPDGRTLLTGGADGTARLWDATTGRPLGPTLTHQGRVWAVAFSPDGQTVLTGGDGRAAQLWDATTGRPLGPTLTHQERVWAVAFSPDGQTVLTGSNDHTARLWDVATDLPDDLERVANWVEVRTGLELDDQGQVRALDAAAWRERREQLGRQGGPPETGQWWRRVVGPESPASVATLWASRGEQHADQQLWAAAQADFSRALELEPDNPQYRIDRGMLFLRRHDERNAAADFLRASDSRPDDPFLARRSAALSWAARDLAGYRRACTRLREIYRRASNSENAHQLVMARIQGPGEISDWGAVIAMGQASLVGAETNAWTHHGLAGAYLRAGGYRDVLRELDESDRFGPENNPLNDLMRTIALARLGRLGEARAVLARTSGRSPGPSRDSPFGEAPTQWRDGLSGARLTQWWDWHRLQEYRGEAEALTLYDPIFPVDPFAR
jgi:WD40 repeat protein/serine/threonine protein kinase/tetratricopeptide (TPR) repeat protein